MMRRRRMGRPGLVGTVARTAVVAGTASAVAGGVNRHQAEKAAAADQEQQQADWAAQQEWAAQQQAAQQAAAPAAGTSDMLTQLKELGELRDQGVLTQAEFDAQKAKLLNA
jgi:hypothetical protein